jgi:murein DD-endopeptidase MepM/ murein hydrolase activator NlpD
MGSRGIRVLVVGLIALAGVWLWSRGGESLGDYVRLFYGTPHQRYAASLRLDDLDETSAGRMWIESSRKSIEHASLVTPPRREALSFDAARPEAAAFAVRLRRGQRYIAERQVAGADPTAVFVDVFERDGDALRHVASAAPDEPAVILEMRDDGEYVVRVQPELQRDARVTLAHRVEPTLHLPVERATRSRIQSFFGDSRDEGRRAHHGVDIFAPRGTPVVAAADGFVTRVGTNGLGGNVIWIARPTRGEVHYYAHLETQLVEAGAFVRKGDVIGTVGNTGNARRTTPHLHFGIYAPGGPVDPLPYIAPAPSAS